MGFRTAQRKNEVCRVARMGTHGDLVELPALGCGEINRAAPGGIKVGYAAAMCDRRMP